jgi:hypothetical protein
MALHRAPLKINSPLDSEINRAPGLISKQVREVTRVVDVAGRWTVDVDAPGFGVQIAEPRTSSDRWPSVNPCQPKGDYSDEVIVLGRLKAGKARESHRVVHVFLLVRDLLQSAIVTARCGVQLTASDMQWLPRLAGMPCERCVMTD